MAEHRDLKTAGWALGLLCGVLEEAECRSGRKACPRAQRSVTGALSAGATSKCSQGNFNKALMRISGLPGARVGPLWCGPGTVRAWKARAQFFKCELLWDPLGAWDVTGLGTADGPTFW